MEIFVRYVNELHKLDGERKAVEMAKLIEYGMARSITKAKREVKAMEILAKIIDVSILDEVREKIKKY